MAPTICPANINGAVVGGQGSGCCGFPGWEVVDARKAYGRPLSYLNSPVNVVFEPRVDEAKLP